MKLLFNSTTDLKELLGFLDADLTFENFKTDLEHASLDITKLIGKAVYNRLEAHFSNTEEFVLAEDGITEAQLNDLVKKAQLPIALFANIAIEANTDLGHGNSGRTAKVGEYEKQPWEWQINKDTQAQRRRAYKSLDILIGLLDEIELPEWIQSDEFKTSKEHFIYTVAQFDRVYSINKSRQLYLRLLPFMEDAEEEFIEPTIGSERFETIKEEILDSDLTVTDTALLKRIQKVVGFFVLADAFKTLPVEMFPEGTVEYREKGRMTSQARSETMEFFTKKAKSHLNKLEKAISKLDAVDQDEVDPVTGLNEGEKFINL